MKCIIDNNVYYFKNGRDVYNQIGEKYMITSITVQNEYIVIKLKENIKNYWEDEYKEQFGEEPSFFNRERRYDK